MAATMALAFSSCTGGGGISGFPEVAWYNVYGQYCFTSQSPGPGCDFYQNGAKVMYNQDPNVAPLAYGTWTYTDVYGNPATFTGYAYATSDGVLYDQNGYAINSVNEHGRDSATNAAAAQKLAINSAAQGLQAKYGLSAEVSQNVATSLNDWAVMGKTRKRTDQDLAEFSKRVTGLDISEVNAALTASAKGDNTAADQAIAKAAANWSTNPDTMKKIISDWYGKQTQAN